MKSEQKLQDVCMHVLLRVVAEEQVPMALSSMGSFWISQHPQ